MSIERLQVTNHERWGRLVKTWATGTNYLDDDHEYPLPTSMEEFKEQLAKAQVFATVPERFKQIQFGEANECCKGLRRIIDSLLITIIKSVVRVYTNHSFTKAQLDVAVTHRSWKSLSKYGKRLEVV